jgi:hypothetical protein
VHALGDVQETASSSLGLDRPTGTGIGCARQLEPFQTSARATCNGDWALSDPTAIHALAEEHDTLVKRHHQEPDGFAVCSVDHRVPFHRSARWPLPTAVHAPFGEHETAVRPLTP